MKWTMQAAYAGAAVLAFAGLTAYHVATHSRTPRPALRRRCSRPTPRTPRSYARITGKDEIARELVAGRLSLLQAAAGFRDLGLQGPPDGVRDVFATAGSADEAYCRSVIGFVDSRAHVRAKTTTSPADWRRNCTTGSRTGRSASPARAPIPPATVPHDPFGMIWTEAGQRVRCGTTAGAGAMSENPEVLLHEAKAGDAATLGRLLETVPALPGPAGPRADRPAPPGQGRCVRPGSGNVPRSAPQLRRLPRRQRGRVRRLAAADPGRPTWPTCCAATSAPRGATCAWSAKSRTRFDQLLGPARPRPGRRRSRRRASRPCAANRPCCWPTPWTSCRKTTARCSCCATSKG